MPQLKPIPSRTGAIAIGVAARRTFAIGVYVLALLAAAGIAVQLLRHVWGFHNLFGFIPLFDFDAEANLPTLFSVFLLACCSALLGLIGAFERRRDRRASNYWFGLSVLAGYVMVDEGAQIHEAVGAAIHSLFHTTGYLFFAWVIPGTAVVAALGILFSRFVLGLEDPLRRRLIISALVYASGGLGMEFIDGNYAANHGMDLTYAMMTACEELLEMAGLLWLLRALLLHAASVGLRIELAVHDDASESR